MKSITQIVSNLVSPWRGSETTYKNVKEQIRSRWGDEEAELYSPITDVMPYLSWTSSGYQVKRHEKALKSITFIDAKGPNGEKKKIRRIVHLFHRNQVQKV